MKTMDAELTRASGFVKRLLANKAMDCLSPLKKEEQIIQFLNINAQALYPTLSSAQFFPGFDWNKISSLLYQAVVLETNAELIPQLEELVRRRIDYTFLSFIQPQALAAEKCQEAILEFLNRLLQKPETRRQFSNPFLAASLSLADRYLEESFDLRQYIHFELTKVQRLRCSVEEIKNLVKATLLLKAGICLMTVVSSNQEQVSGVVQAKFVDKVFDTLSSQYKIIPRPLLRGALNSAVSFQDDKKIETVARLAAVFAARVANYVPNTNVDRGANTPDRSWFNIARKNYKYFGFDIKILDELYKIAAENGW